MTTARTIIENATILTRAHQAARKVRTESDALAWRDEHLYPNIENGLIYDDLMALDRAIVLRVTGAGGG